MGVDVGELRVGERRVFELGASLVGADELGGVDGCLDPEGLVRVAEEGVGFFVREALVRPVLQAVFTSKWASLKLRTRLAAASRA